MQENLTRNHSGIAASFPMLAAALDAAEKGWRVFPCEPDGPDAKAPMINHGHTAATGDPEVIRYWWGERPNAMIGATVPDPYAVIDLDPRSGGTLQRLWVAAGPLPETLTVWSGRNDGGRHLYFRRPASMELTSTGLPKGIDLKIGGRGYAIIPPSIHPVTGQPYSWELHPVADMTPGLMRVLRAPERPRCKCGHALHSAKCEGKQSCAQFPAFELHPCNCRERVKTDTRSGAGLIRAVRDGKPGERHGVLVWAAFRAAEGGILDKIGADLERASIESGHDGTDARRVLESVGRS